MACRIVGQSRGTQKYVPKLRPDEDELTRNIVLVAPIHGRHGYRRVTAMLTDSPWRWAGTGFRRRAMVLH